MVEIRRCSSSQIFEASNFDFANFRFTLESGQKIKATSLVVHDDPLAALWHAASTRLPCVDWASRSLTICVREKPQRKKRMTHLIGGSDGFFASKSDQHAEDAEDYQDADAVVSRPDFKLTPHILQ